jgi:hypothetical protein
LSYVKLKRHLEATAAKHQVIILFLIFDKYEHLKLLKIYLNH